MNPLHVERRAYWVPVAAAARLSGRTYQTMRRWAEDGRVKTRRDPATGDLQVWLWSAFDEDLDTPRRNRRAS